MQHLYLSHKNTNNATEAYYGEVWPHSQMHVIFFASLSSWEGQSLKGKQELERRVECCQLVAGWVVMVTIGWGHPAAAAAALGFIMPPPIYLSLSVCPSVLLLLLLPLFSACFPLVWALPDGVGWVTRWKEGWKTTWRGRNWQMKKKQTKSPMTVGTGI